MQLLLRWNQRSLRIVPLFFAGPGRLISLIRLLGLMLLAQPALQGQSAPVSTFSTGVNLVEVYATVTDRGGQPVTGLTAADFRVIEDSVPQAITTFTAGEFPLSVAIALDRSFSMAGERLALSKQAARAFIAALRPTDEVMVLAIGSEIDTITPPVSARDALATRWESIDAWGTTPLYDATAQALDAIAAGSGRRALLLISDGNDRDSRTTATDLVARARASNVLVYPVAIGAKPPVFAELANVTGGRTFFIEDPKRLESQLATLARELRFQYLLGYTPSPGADPGWRAIEVTVSRPDVRVRARDGYFAR
jgi:Ca-activated chloride channel family protein